MKTFKKLNGKISTGFLALVASGSAMASTTPTANEAAINAAVASGKSMVGLTSSGVIGVAALCFGLALVIRWLAK